MPLQKVWLRLSVQSRLSCLDAVGWQKPGPLVELLHLVDEPSRAHIAAGLLPTTGITAITYRIFIILHFVLACEKLIAAVQ